MSVVAVAGFGLKTIDPARASIVSTDTGTSSFAGSVGIRTTAPATALDVRGQTRSVAAGGSAQVNSSATIDWNNGNTQALSAACTSTTMQNMADGGTYLLVVTDTTATTCTFSQSGLTFLYNPANASRTAGQQTVFTFQRIGSTVYTTWITGFQ